MGGVPKTAEISRVFSSALPKICSEYPFENPHSRHRSPGERLASKHCIHRHRLRWVGHVIWLDNDRIPKQLLYGELSVGSRPQHKPKKRFKDCVKDSLALCKIDDTNWEMSACDRNRCRKWSIVDPVASKTVRISRLKQG